MISARLLSELFLANTILSFGIGVASSFLCLWLIRMVRGEHKVRLEGEK